ncbi:hypothetical protein KQH61_03805 [bacterium]|nr:hypothetical protein [bacterium]MCB2179027.1 hypothetical protein [bacterium]
MSQKRQFWILSLVAILSVLGWVWYAAQAGTLGFPLDDGWIHQTYARSLASGAGWAYYPGQPSAGATAPLWVLLLVPGYWLGTSPLCWVLFLALVLNWGMAVLAFRAWPYLSKKGGVWPLAAGLVVALEWHLLWAALSGMETLLMAMWIFAGLAWLMWLAAQPEEREPAWHWLGIGALTGLGVWVRPEAVTLLGPALFVGVLKSASGNKVRLRRVGLVLGGAVLLFGPYLAFNHWLAGAWWPNTFFAKQAEYAVLRETPLLTRLVQQPLPLLAGVGAVLLPGFLWKTYLAVRERDWAALAGSLWLIGFLGLYALRLPVTYQHGRYILPGMPVLAVWGLAGAAEVIASGKTAGVRWVLGRVWAGLIVLFTVMFWATGMDAFSRDVAVINGEMVDVAHWLTENTAEDDLIAAHDIGAIGYFAQRQIVDLAGLISPDVIPFIRDETQLAAYLDVQCPQYLVTFPSWYPEMVDGLEMVYRTNAAITRDMGRGNMAVYIWPGCVP